MYSSFVLFLQSFCRYPKEYSNPIHQHYEEGVSFMLAFSGCNTYISKEECNALYVSYADKALVQ